MSDPISFGLDAFLSSYQLSAVKKYQELFNNPNIIVGNDFYQDVHKLYCFDFEQLQVKTYHLTNQEIIQSTEQVFELNAVFSIIVKRIVSLLNQTNICLNINILDDYIEFTPRCDEFFNEPEIIGDWYKLLYKGDSVKDLEDFFYIQNTIDFTLHPNDYDVITFVKDSYFITYGIQLNKLIPGFVYQPNINAKHSNKIEFSHYLWSIDSNVVVDALKETILLFKDGRFDYQADHSNILSGKLPQLPIFQTPERNDEDDDYDDGEE